VPPCCRVVYFHTQNTKLGIFWRALELKMWVHTFSGHLQYFTTVWYMFSAAPFGNFVVIWYVFSVLVYCPQKNLESLEECALPISLYPKSWGWARTFDRDPYKENYTQNYSRLRGLFSTGPRRRLKKTLLHARTTTWTLKMTKIFEIFVEKWNSSTIRYFKELIYCPKLKPYATSYLNKIII
jgi:hypothetical protein